MDINNSIECFHSISELPQELIPDSAETCLHKEFVDFT